MPKAKSYVSKGRVHFYKTGRYNETTTSAENAFDNDASSASKQKNLAPVGSKSAAALTINRARKELKW